MTLRHDIEERLRSLKDISEIMDAMRNLSVIETRRIGRFLANHQRVVDSIAAAGADFASAYGAELSRAPATCRVILGFGSQRGFCGDFNETLAQAVDDHVQRNSGHEIRLIAVGSKFDAALARHHHRTAFVEAPAVAQEIEPALSELVKALTEINTACGPISVDVIHHSHKQSEVIRSQLLPPFGGYIHSKPRSHPPLLHVAPVDFYSGLVDHYLFAALHGFFYTSLMAEHSRRAQHLESAIKRLQDKSTLLARKRNMLRQEEITEEIEVMMLNMGLSETF